MGTPGRILALANQGALKLEKLKYFILDECDRMLDQLDMRGDVQQIYLKTPKNKQVMVRGGDPGQDPTPKGRGGVLPPSTDPKMVVQNNGFCGRQRRRRFVLGIRQGEIFLSNLMCLYSKYSKFCGELKNG